MESADKLGAYVDKTLQALEKRGFQRVGDTFYSPSSMAIIEDGSPPWAEKRRQFSRVRTYLFVL